MPQPSQRGFITEPLSLKERTETAVFLRWKWVSNIGVVSRPHRRMPNKVFVSPDVDSVYASPIHQHIAFGAIAHEVPVPAPDR
jgi:hypothetical protein